MYYRRVEHMIRRSLFQERGNYLLFSFTIRKKNVCGHTNKYVVGYVRIYRQNPLTYHDIYKDIPVHFLKNASFELPPQNWNYEQYT